MYSFTVKHYTILTNHGEKPRRKSDLLADTLALSRRVNRRIDAFVARVSWWRSGHILD